MFQVRSIKIMDEAKSPTNARLKNARIALTATAFDEYAPNFYTNLFATKINFSYEKFATKPKIKI